MYSCFETFIKYQSKLLLQEKNDTENQTVIENKARKDARKMHEYI